MADLTQLAPIPGSDLPMSPEERDNLISGMESLKGREGLPKQKGKRKGQQDEGEFSDYVLSRPELHNVALFGVLREMVDAACANSEAVRPTVAIHILARFAATIGRTAYIQIGDQQRHLRMNALIVGPTAKGRKGTSAEMPSELFRLAEARLEFWPLRKLTALATGEGLIYLVRDAFHDHEGKLVDAGVDDKRLLFDVSEFAGVLAQARREAATISTVLRDAFDGVPLVTPTKTSHCEASDTHIVVIGSVPETEIVKTLTSTDITNGLANRFPMFYSVRDKIVPMPRATDPQLMRGFAAHLASAIYEATRSRQIAMDADALEYWSEIYHALEAKAHPPAIAALLARQSTYTLIFSALLALLNRQAVVSRDHLDAALAWVQYWEDTTLFVFSNGEQNEQALKMKGLKDEIVQAIATLGGVKVKHSAMAEKVTNKYQKAWPLAKDVKSAVELLERESPPRIYSETVTTPGRSSNLYSLAPQGDD
jgi:putative DNA primase/helicase